MLEKIPVIGRVAKKVWKKIKGGSPFTTSEKYWEDRYKRGGNSGLGSYNDLAVFKASIINAFVDKNQLSTIIEFGCGDGNQLKYFNFKSYTGYDVSSTAIAICRELHKGDSSKQFKPIGAYEGEQASLTLSLDVIYHLIEEEIFAAYMEKLFNASEKFVIVYSSNADEHPNNGMHPHVKHRKFTQWVEENAPQFKLIEHIPNKYPYQGNTATFSYADFYIFQKQK